MLMYELFVKDNVGKKQKMKCILPFLFVFQPLFFFFFSAVNSSVLLILQLLSLACARVVQLLWARVRFLTPVDVFCRGGAERSVDEIFSDDACLKYKSYAIGT